MSSERKYFEAIGAIKTLLLTKLKERRDGIDALHDFFAKYGGDEVAYLEYFRFEAALAMKSEASEPLNAKLWRRLKNNRRIWTPRLGTKQGKAIAAELRKLENAVVSRCDLADIIKMSIWGADMSVNLPGFDYHKKRLFVVVPSVKYRPPNGMELVRVSDVDYERLTSKRKAVA